MVNELCQTFYRLCQLVDKLTTLDLEDSGRSADKEDSGCSADKEGLAHFGAPKLNTDSGGYQQCPMDTLGHPGTPTPDLEPWEYPAPLQQPSG